MIELVEVSLNGTNKNDEINEENDYLAKIYDEYHAGPFSEQWYGWNFIHWHGVGIQLDGIEKLWLIKGE